MVELVLIPSNQALRLIFIARQHAHVCRARYCFANSVCLSNAGIASNEWTCHQTFL